MQGQLRPHGAGAMLMFAGTDVGYFLQTILAATLVVAALAKVFFPLEDSGLALLLGRKAALRVQRGLVPAEIGLAGLMVASAFTIVATTAATSLFLAGLVYTAWLYTHHPNVGCGCAGRAGAGGVGRAQLANSIFLVVLSSAASAVSWLHGDPQPGWLAALLGMSAAVLANSATLSRLRHLRSGLGQPVDCATQLVEALGDSLNRLYSSHQWDSIRGQHPDQLSFDHWREACWRFFAFQAEGGVVAAGLDLGPSKSIHVTFIPEEVEPVTTQRLSSPTR